MSTNLFILATILAALSTLFFAYRTGDRLQYMDRPEQVGRSGVILALAGLFVGLFARASQDGVAGEFLWFHWPLLVAGILCVSGYGTMYVQNLRMPDAKPRVVPTERLQEVDEWLQDIAEKEPCVTVDCRDFRDRVPEMRRVLAGSTPTIEKRITMTTTPALQTDARNRAFRTMLQGLAFDVAAALCIVLFTVFSSADGWGDFEWALLGFTLVKTFVVTGLAYLMRTVFTSVAPPEA